MQATGEREPKRRPQGARRRAELLAGLRSLLGERPLDEIEIADVTERAGAARSLFYFYFPSKAGAVGALLEELLAELMAAGFSEPDGLEIPPEQLVRERVDAVVALWRANAALILAMVEAAGADPRARRQWDRWGAGFAARARVRIAHDQAAGLARPEIDAGTLAEMLTGMTMAAMARDVRALAATGEPLPRLADTLVHVWTCSLYP